MLHCILNAAQGLIPRRLHKASMQGLYTRLIPRSPCRASFPGLQAGPHSQVSMQGLIPRPPQRFNLTVISK